jgi:hypothetical protein
MPPLHPDATTDFEKLQLAWQDFTTKFGSVTNILQAMGLAELPTAQRYGIFFGFLVFVLTISTVLVLLVLGGTWQRILAEQQQQQKNNNNNNIDNVDENGLVSIQSDFQVRLERPLLLERLLQSRQWLLQQNYAQCMERISKTVTTTVTTTTTTTSITNLTKTLSNVAPPQENDDKDENSNNNNNNKNSNTAIFDFSNQRAETMVGYQQNYFMGYRKCQDKPGGKYQKKVVMVVDTLL